MQIPVIKKVQELGYICIVADQDENAPGFQYADFNYIVSTLDYDGILSIATKNNIDGILTTSDLPVRTVAYVCERLDLNGLSRKAANICTDKFMQREILSNCNQKIIVPKHVLIQSSDNITNKIKNLEFPLMVKPIDSSASRGVSKINNIVDLEYAYQHAMQYSKNGKVIIEEFIEGPEYSVESITLNGRSFIIAITEKTIYQTNGTSFVESRHVIPAELENNKKREIEEFVKFVSREFDINNCATHTEIKITKNGIVLIEMAARLGGDYITSDLVPLATGVDMLKNIIHISINEPINICESKKMYAGIQFIDANSYKIAKDFITKNGNKLFRYELKPFKDTAIRSSLDRLGYIIASNKSRKDLIKILDFKS